MLRHLAKLKEGVEAWNAWRNANPRLRPDLRGANLAGADLRGFNFFGADLDGAHLDGADLRGAGLIGVDFYGTTLIGADLRGVDLRGADLNATDLSKATLIGANLTEANLIETKLCGADLTDARIYGISAWNVERDDNTAQSGLIITHPDEATVTVDDLEVAQFVYLLLTNKSIRQVIDTITSRAVLILGRFKPERKKVLDAIHECLREKFGLVPILFDWRPPKKRDLTETVVTLAGMCRFIVADLSDAKSIPHELSHIIPTFQSVPIRPIILASQREYAMHEHWEKFNNVLSVFAYNDQAHLVGSLKTEILEPVEAWEKATDKESARKQESAARERRLKERNARQAAEIVALKAKLKVP